MNILMIVGGCFLALGVTLIVVISLLPSPTITQLLRRFGKRGPVTGAQRPSPR